jgi:hypothetical protein
VTRHSAQKARADARRHGGAGGGGADEVVVADGAPLHEGPASAVSRAAGEVVEVVIVGDWFFVGIVIC